MRRQTSRLLVVLPASLLLVAPVGAAHAAKANPWSAYFPAKGVTCTSTVVHADGRTESQRTTVVAKSAKKVVTRISGEGRSTSLLLEGGRLRTTAAMTERELGIRVRASVRADYPSPTRLLHRHPGSGTMTMAMTLPQWMAGAMLKSGRTLTITGTYRMRGLGLRRITLADPAATSVKALGVRTKLRSLKIFNVKADYERELKKELRSAFASMEDTEWVARGRGSVRDVSTDEDGSVMTTTQVGCS